MPIAEGIAARVVYKFYASGEMVSNQEADILTQPGRTAAQTLRRVSTSLAMGKDTYSSNERRTDRQIADMRHGGRRGQGSISGELSPKTYFDFISAAHRDTPAGPLSLNKTQLTSIAAANAAGTITFAGGDPVALGLGVGDIVRIAAATSASLNGTNFLITGFSGTSNRVLAVFPAPAADAAADTGSWTLSRPGKVTLVPSSGFVKRKLAVEIYNEDAASGRFFPEHRVTGYRFGLPVNGMNTFEVTLLGRGMRVLDATTSPTAPYFTAAADVTTTGVTGPMEGVLLLGNKPVGLVTGLNIGLSLAADAPIVRGQKFVPEVFLSAATLTGDITAFLDGHDLTKAWTDETELSLLTSVFADTSASAEGMAIFLPRIKFTSGDTPTEGDSGQTFNGGFQALKYQGTAPGVANTTVRVHDTAA